MTRVQLYPAAGWYHLSPVLPRLHGQQQTYTAVPLAAWRVDAFGDTLGLIAVTDDGKTEGGHCLQPVPRVSGASYVTAEQLRELRNDAVVTTAYPGKRDAA